MLNKQAKKDFEKWLTNQTHQINIWGMVQFNGYAVELFYKLPESMQYGVIVDWFFSVGYPININLIEYGFDADETIYKCEVTIGFRDIGFFDSNSQARQKAIEKANLLYNNR